MRAILSGWGKVEDPRERGGSAREHCTSIALCGAPYPEWRL